MRLRAWERGSVGACVLVLALLLGSAVAAGQSAPATVIIVRHAEKAAEPKADPPLAAEGRIRAEALLEVLRDAGVSVIYSTDRLRNLETSRVVAEGLQIPVVEVPIVSGKIDAYAQAIVERVRKEGGGRVSLVVGHSNTLGAVIRAFGGPDIGEIADSRHDDLFVLTVQDGQPPRLIRGKYGRVWEAVTK